MVESLQTNRDDAKRIHLISNMCVVIDYMIQIMLSLTFISFIEYVINLEVHNLAYFYSNRVRFERLGTEGIEIDSQSQSLVQTKVANQSSPAFCYECCHFPIKIRWRIGLIGISSLITRHSTGTRPGSPTLDDTSSLVWNARLNGIGMS